MSKEKYICPICGYDALEYYPEQSYEICPSCGYQFGIFEYCGEDLSDKFYLPKENNDVYQYIRDKWIKNGAKWCGDHEKKPCDWKYKEQLKKLIQKERLFENCVIELFASQNPELEEYIKNVHNLYDLTEGAGMYIVLPPMVEYLTDCVDKNDFIKAERFLNTYDEFYEKFEQLYNKLHPDDSMKNLTYVELFEIIDGYKREDREKVVSLMSCKLQNIYKNFNNIFTNKR